MGYSKKMAALASAARAYDAACEKRRKAYEKWRTDRIRKGVGDERLAKAADAARGAEYEAEEALREAARNFGGKP